jgi:hypothetical protein
MNEITYRIDLEDMRALNANFSRTSPLHWKIRIAFVAFAAAVLLAVTVEMRGASPGFQVGFFAAMLGLSILFGMACSFLVGRLHFALIRQTRLMGTGMHSTVLTPDFISDRSEEGELITPWHAVHHIASTADHIYIFDRPLSACIIPRAAFRTSEEAETFLGMARWYQEAATRGLATARVRVR